MAFQLMALLVVLKVLATTSSYASGNAGGIFGPSLFIGAMTGGAVGSLAHAAMPQSTANPGAYALVGMGTAFAGIVRVPLTSVIMIFEMTRDYSIIVPLMISNLVSFYISFRLQRQPIYEALALQDGVHLPSPSTHRMTSQLRVSAAMRTPELTIEPTMNPDRAIRLMNERRVHQLPVAEGSKFLGMLSKVELETSRLDTLEVRALLGNGHFPHLHPDHTLDIALHRMGSSNLQELPVVSRRDIHKLEGIVALEDVLRLYGIGKTNWTTD